MAREDGISIWGDRFVAQIDFNKAIRDADTLDGQLARITANVRYLGTTGKAQIDAFAASIGRAAAAAGMILGPGGNMLPGSGVVGAGGWMLGYGSVGQGQYVPRRPALPPPSGMPTTPQQPALPAPTNLTSRDYRYVTNSQGRMFRAGPMGSLNEVPGFIYSPGASYQRPFGGPPTPPGAPYGGNVAPGMELAIPGPMGQSSPWRPTLGAQAMFYGQRYWTQPSANALGAVRSSLGFVNLRNLLALSSSLYLTRNVGNAVQYVARSTIGEAMNLQERQVLLANALMSPKMGIGRELANKRSVDLTTTQFFSGLPVSAPEMGLSAPELAEQYRQLAPIVRITAKNQAEFQAGLQTGALARALLVARDPVQGTRGAMVSLSELYSGGPDRFRSLALRFELPRNRLREIEAQMGGPGTADPGRVLIQMLSEMGFGPTYLQRRTETLAGQLDRTQALGANFKVELFGEAMDKVRQNLTKMNDAFEFWLNSPAGDEAIAKLDRLFGRFTSVLTTGASNFLSGGMLGMPGAMSPHVLAKDIGDYLVTSGGHYSNPQGEIISAADAFREAAKTLTDRNLQQFLRSPTYQPGTSVFMRSGLYGLGILGAGGLANRLAGGAFTGALGTLLRGGGAAVAGAQATAGLGALGTAALPLAGIAGISYLAGNISEARATGSDWRQFARLHPELARQTNMPRWTPDWLVGMDQAVANLPIIGSFYQSPGELTTRAKIMRKGGIQDALNQQAALGMIGGASQDSVMSGIIGTLNEYVAQNPDSPLANERTFGQYVGATRAFLGSGKASTELNTTLLEVALRSAAKRDTALIGPSGIPGMGGKTYAPDPMAIVEGGDKAISKLYQTVLRDAGSPEAARDVFVKMLEELGAIRENTAKAAENAFAYIRPSEVGDIFTGYTQSPDMRFTRRSGIPLPSAVSATTTAKTAGLDRFNITAGNRRGQYDQTITATPFATGKGGYSNYFGGILSQGGGWHAKRSYGLHQGIDYVDSDSTITAPYEGTIEYLSSPEDFKRYSNLFPGGFKEYGNTVLFRDVTGVSMTSFSHLTSQSVQTYGKLGSVHAGQTIGSQGSTGRSTGPHVHRELFLSDGKGGVRRVNPLFSESLYKNMPAVERAASGGGGINLDLGGVKINVSGGNPEEVAKEATEQILAHPTMKQRLTSALLSAIIRDGGAVRILTAGQKQQQREGTGP